jgi:hypothetical protein
MLSLDGSDVVLALEIKPELCAVPEIATESHGCIGGNGAATIKDVSDTAGRHPEIKGEPVCTEIARLQLAFQEAARMWCERHGLTSVIINDLNIVRIAPSERKADAPARVHCHGPLSGSVTLELVKPNALERAEITQRLGDVQSRQQVH